MRRCLFSDLILETETQVPGSLAKHNISEITGKPALGLWLHQENCLKLDFSKATYLQPLSIRLWIELVRIMV